ncbi:MAG: hypothetical protein ACUZ8H_07310 [Candidatus Anammoxibacter sp.]
MIDFCVLKELFQDKILGNVGEKYGRCFVRLKEKDKKAKLNKIDIYDVPNDSMLIKLDVVDPPHSLFKTGKGECKRCDYILIMNKENRSILLFIEIKSVKELRTPSKIRNQFRGAECIIDYCNATLRRFHNKNNFFDKFNKYFVVFYKPSLAKLTTRQTQETVIQSVCNNTPERMLKYPSPHNPSLYKLINL